MQTVMMHNPEADVLTRRQAAARLNVTVNTLNRWAMQGRGPAYSLTGITKGRALYSAATIAEWLESRKQPPRACRGKISEQRGA